MTVRVALIGCGAMGEIVAREFYASPSGDRYRLVAAVDIRRDRAASLGVPGFVSLDEMFAAGVSVDAVDIRLPHHLHAGAAVDAAGRGLHLLVEKPLATTLADGTAVVEAASRAGVVAAVAENYPHLAAVRAARGAIADGAVGEVLAVRSTRVYPLGGVWTRDGWRQDGGPSAGILLDQGTHQVSLLRRLAGEIESVSAVAAGDTVAVSLRFVSGVVGQSLYSWGSPAVDGEPEATVFGSRGRIDIGVSYTAAQGKAVWYDGTGRRELSEPENYYDSHRLIIDDWAGAITERRKPVVPVADALADLAVVLAAIESISLGGRPVEVVHQPQREAGFGGASRKS